MDEARRRWLRRIVAGLVAAAVLGLGLWAFLSAGEPDDAVGPQDTSEPTTSAPSTDAATPSVTPSLTPDEQATPPADGPDETEPAVGFDETASFGTEVRARIVSLESVDGEAVAPGEVAGPAIRVTIELTNDTGSEVSLSSTVVNAFTGADLAPADALTSGAQWFEGTLAPGDVATGVYVFTVPSDRRDLLQVTVSYEPTAPTVLFEGAAPAA